MNNGPGGREGDRGRCPIQAHNGMRHDWRGCHLDPLSRRYDAKAGQEFHNNEAHGPNVWYRGTFEKASGQSHAFSVGQGGGGRGGNDHQGRGGRGSNGQGSGSWHGSQGQASYRQGSGGNSNGTQYNVPVPGTVMVPVQTAHGKGPCTGPRQW